MKKILSIMLSMVMVICLAISVSAEPGVQNGDSLSVVQPGGGAYVIVTNLVPGDLDFNYGWNNSKEFTSEPLGYWIGVYDLTASTYVWFLENQFVIPDPKMIKLSSLDTSTLVSGHNYVINFFVRDAYDYWGEGVSNVTEVQVYFTAP